MVEYRFDDRNVGAHRWELVLVKMYDFRSVVWVPGYESSRYGDLVKACLYLNSGFRGYLDEYKIALLDQIRESIPEQYREKMYYK
jgi:hypothetical protein